MHSINDVASERLQTDSRIFAFTRWDIIPVLAEFLHLAYFFGMFFLFPHAPQRLLAVLGAIPCLVAKQNALH